MLSESERIALYTLLEFPGMYTRKLNFLYRYTGSFEKLLHTGETELRHAGLLNERMEKGIFERCRNDATFLADCRRNYSALDIRGIRMIDYSEPDMPERFKELADRPCALFVKGRLPDPGRPCAAIIGSRSCSEYGSAVASSIGKTLSGRGVQIISGMAMGIDTDALDGGLEGSSDCFAVLGSGVDVCYPSGSRKVYDRIRKGRGGILSEFCPSAKPLGYHFITRNRLIAALCDVLIVIEAKEKSGTTITVENALELGRDVFALPGRITDPLGYGCNRLIKEGAQVLTCAEDVLEHLGIGSDGKCGPLQGTGAKALSETEKKILSLMGPDPEHIEVLSLRLGLPIGAVSSLLSELEEKGNIRDAGNAYYAIRYR